jgi:hypothetical protein
MTFVNAADKPSLDEALVHFGVKGMKWGVRKNSISKTGQQGNLKKLQKKMDRLDADRAIEGYNYRGWAGKKVYKKMVKKNSKFAFNKLSKAEQVAYLKKIDSKAKRDIALMGAAEVAIILGGGNLLVNKMASSPNARRGAKVSVAILAAQAGRIRVNQIRAVNTAGKMDRLREQIKELEPSRK